MQHVKHYFDEMSQTVNYKAFDTKWKKTEKLQAKNNDFIVAEMIGQCWESLSISVYCKVQ